jgi:ribosome-binding factor A
MPKQRVDRLNSLLKEVISDVIRRDFQNRDIPELITITHVEITKDLHYAKVFVGVIGDQAVKNKAIERLTALSAAIGVVSSKKVVMRYFPALTFILDDSLDKHMRIEEILKEIHDEKESRDNESLGG